MVDLLKHNQEAFQEINKMIDSGIKKIAVPRPTGSGKTYLMGALAEKYNYDKKLVNVIMERHLFGDRKLII